MRETQSENVAFRWIRFFGTMLFLLMVFVVPLTVLPAAYLINFDTDRSESLIVKLLVMDVLCAGILLLGAAMLFAPENKRLTPGRALPAIMLLLFWVWSLVPVAASPVREWSFYHWLIVGFPSAAALTGIFFFPDAKSVRRLIVTLLAVATILCAIGVVSALGWRQFNVWAYGMDPRTALEENTGKKPPPGGADRGASWSTLGNPEYAGGFAAAAAALAAIVVFDFAPKSRRPWLVRGFGLGVCTISLMELAVTGTRQPWNALLLAGALRLFLALDTPPLLLAAGFCAVLLTVYTFGVAKGAALLLVFLVVPLVLAARRGALMPLLRNSDRFNVVSLVAGPALMVLLLIAFSIPGPWNPNGLRLMQRFTSVTQSTDSSMIERQLMYLTASEIAFQHPFVGAGPGRYSNLFSNGLTMAARHDGSGVVEYYKRLLIHKITDQAHNDYLQITAELGLPGLVLFLSLIVAVLHGLHRLIRTGDPETRLAALALFFCLITFLGMMLTSFPLQMPSRAVFFWSIIAASIGLTANGGPSTTSEAVEA